MLFILSVELKIFSRAFHFELDADWLADFSFFISFFSDEFEFGFIEERNDFPRSSSFFILFKLREYFENNNFIMKSVEVSKRSLLFFGMFSKFCLNYSILSYEIELVRDWFI